MLCCYVIMFVYWKLISNETMSGLWRKIVEAMLFVPDGSIQHPGSTNLERKNWVCDWSGLFPSNFMRLQSFLTDFIPFLLPLPHCPSGTNPPTPHILCAWVFVSISCFIKSTRKWVITSCVTVVDVFFRNCCFPSITLAEAKLFSLIHAMVIRSRIYWSTA